MGRVLRHLALLSTAALLLGGAAVSHSRHTISGRVLHAGTGSGLLVYVVHAPGHFPPPAKHRVMDQRNMHFVPEVLPVLLGTTVDFLNSDTVAHNVFSPDHEGYNLGTWPPGQRRSYTFTRLGVYTQLCSIHPKMQAYVVVLQNPYFAITGAGGRFRIPEVPNGRYELAVFGPGLTKAERARRFSVHLRGRAEKVTVDLAKR